ncbi:hypothetical protein [Acidipropionibacterium timonense]|uniref:hypothetical protein n=1 Tax=Acidipropionibacterium timonense TaxID=2161818 RepID=UPI00102FDBF8|nr:hypothetical protein [Acidipropionibacterium timonense]
MTVTTRPGGVDVVDEVERPYGFAMPRVAPLASPQPDPAVPPAPTDRPGDYSLPPLPPLSTLVPRTGPTRDPAAPFDTTSAGWTHRGEAGDDPRQPFEIGASIRATPEADAHPVVADEVGGWAPPGTDEVGPVERTVGRLPAPWRGRGPLHTADRSVGSLIRLLGWGLPAALVLGFIGSWFGLLGLALGWVFAATHPVIARSLRLAFLWTSVVVIVLTVVGTPVRDTLEQLCWACRLGCMVLLPVCLVIADRHLSPLDRPGPPDR